RSMANALGAMILPQLSLLVCRNSTDFNSSSTTSCAIVAYSSPLQQFHLPHFRLLVSCSFPKNTLVELPDRDLVPLAVTYVISRQVALRGYWYYQRKSMRVT
ncbi:hypothetical protein B0H16DRAFT_1493252, partial [Mycena metata]